MVWEGEEGRVEGGRGGCGVRGGRGKGWRGCESVGGQHGLGTER